MKPHPREMVYRYLMHKCREVNSVLIYIIKSYYCDVTSVVCIHSLLGRAWASPHTSESNSRFFIFLPWLLGIYRSKTTPSEFGVVFDDKSLQPWYNYYIIICNIESSWMRLCSTQWHEYALSRLLKMYRKSLQYGHLYISDMQQGSWPMVVCIREVPLHLSLATKLKCEDLLHELSWGFAPRPPSFLLFGLHWNSG